MSHDDSPLIMSPSPSAGKDSTKAFTIFVQQMNLHGLLKTDDLITRWGEIGTQVKISVQTVVSDISLFTTFSIFVSLFIRHYIVNSLISFR